MVKQKFMKIIEDMDEKEFEKYLSTQPLCPRDVGLKGSIYVCENGESCIECWQKAFEEVKTNE
ncbi:hypothetical protein [Clostridium sp. DL1XJH146]